MPSGKQCEPPFAIVNCPACIAENDGGA
jgi:hypothetical protein